MNILIVSQYFYPENFRVNILAKELVNIGHKVTVLTGYPQYPEGKIYCGYGFDIPYEHEWNGVRIERVKVHARGHNALGMLRNCIDFVCKGNKWVRKCKEKFDTVYVFGVSPVTVGLPAIRYKKKFGVPVFFNVQDLWPENVEEILGIHNKIIIGTINKIVDKIYRNSDKILCSSNGFVENIANKGVPKEKLVYWPQFCENPDFTNAVKPAYYDDNYFNIAFTGNIGYAQGLDLIINAFDKLRDLPIRCYLVGDGRAKARLEEKVKQLNLTESIYFMGRVTEQEANNYVKFADCAYLSFKDSKLFDLTIPAKLQTYLACGTPILGAVGGESAKIIEEAQCGWVCDKNSEALADIIKNKVVLLNNSDELKNNATRYFDLHFRKDILICDLANLMSN